MEKIKIRCRICREDMKSIVLAFRDPAQGCDEECPDSSHVHTRCDTCSMPGAFYAFTFRSDGTMEMI